LTSIVAIALVGVFAFTPLSVHAAQDRDRDQAAEKQAKPQRKADCEPSKPTAKPMMDDPFTLTVAGSACPEGPKKKQK